MFTSPPPSFSGAPRHWGVVAVCALGLWVSNAAHAHGPAPAPLSPLLAGVDARPALLLTNIGLARTDGTDGYAYGCPSEWDRDGDGEYDVTTPLAAATDDVVVVAGDPDLYRSDDGACSFEPIGPLAGEGPRTLAFLVVGGRVLALLDRAPRRDLVDALTGETLFSTTGDLHSAVATEDGLVLAGVVPGQVPQARLVHLDAAGAVIEERLLPSPSTELSRLTLRHHDPLDGALWGSASVNGGVALWHIDDAVVELSGPHVTLHGPVALCDTIVWATGGALYWPDDRPPACDLSPLDDAQVRCLGAAGGDTWLCDVFTLRRVREESGALIVEPAYELDQLSGPDLSCLDGERRERCEASWIHFGAEAGLLDEDSTDAGPGEVETPLGCASTTGGSALWVLMVGLLRRRRR